MTLKNFPAQNAAAPDAVEGTNPEGAASALDALAASVAGFEASQKSSLDVILDHTASLRDEFALLAARPAPEQLAAAERTAAALTQEIDSITGERNTARDLVATLEGELADAQTLITGLESDLSTAGKSADVAAKELEAANTRSADAAKGLTAAQDAIAERDRELTVLREAAAKDAAIIQSFRDRFRSFEEAAQSIMAGIALNDAAPSALAVPASTTAPESATTAVVADPFDLNPEDTPASATTPAIAAAVVPDPFDLSLEDAQAPAGIVLPDLEEPEENPFDSADSRARTALLASTVGPEDPFDVPEAAAGSNGSGFSFVPAPLADIIEESSAEVPAAPEEAQEQTEAQEPAELAGGSQEDSQPADETAEAEPSEAAAPADPLAFMDFDLGLDDLKTDGAPDGGVVPEPAPVQRVVPVYI